MSFIAKFWVTRHQFHVFQTFLHRLLRRKKGSSPRIFIKSKKQDNSGVAPLRAKDGIIYSGNNNKAEILNNQFKSAHIQKLRVLSS